METSKFHNTFVNHHNNILITKKVRLMMIFVFASVAICWNHNVNFHWQRSVDWHFSVTRLKSFCTLYTKYWIFLRKGGAFLSSMMSTSSAISSINLGAMIPRDVTSSSKCISRAVDRKNLENKLGSHYR